MTSLAQSLIARTIKESNLMQALSEHCNSVSARVTSRDQAVSAEVDATGAMTGLWLSPAASKLDPGALAKLIVDTAGAAAQVVLERQAYLYQEFNNRMEDVRSAPLTCWDGTTFVQERQPRS